MKYILLIILILYDIMSHGNDSSTITNQKTTPAPITSQNYNIEKELLDSLNKLIEYQKDILIELRAISERLYLDSKSSIFQADYDLRKGQRQLLSYRNKK